MSVAGSVAGSSALPSANLVDSVSGLETPVLPVSPVENRRRERRLAEKLTAVQDRIALRELRDKVASLCGLCDKVADLQESLQRAELRVSAF